MTDDFTGSEAEVRRSFEAAGQGHVFRFFEQLERGSRERFLAELQGVDLPTLARLIRELKADRPVSTIDLGRLKPAPFISLPRTSGARRKENRAIAAGEEILRAGKVAAFVVAGGQGSRLGYDGPKGCYPVGPISGCSLFEWHFSKVLASRRRYGAAIPIFVLTSQANHEETEEFLRENSCFGLPREDVILFRQGMLPAVDRDGRLLLSSKSSLFLSPDGHGGSLAALAREGALTEMERRAIEQIYYFQVDNPLARVLEPAFLGHHVLAGSQMSSKCVPKRDAAEKVGVFARTGRSLGVVEYSDLPEELAAARDAEGELLYRAGNIAIHALSVEFVRQVTSGGPALPYHRAAKAVRYVDAAGKVVTPDGKNGVKFETFVFDALPLARKTLVVEASRAEEFSPLKNRTGQDSPGTARDDLSSLFRSWLEAAGLAPARPDALVEISPLFSLDREQFSARVRKERQICEHRLLIS
ncbi:MAG: UTP--glucose-1-phosphate uridylyltransferase [Planctomycetota bacterium]